MKAIVKSMALLFALIMISCGGKKEEKKRKALAYNAKRHKQNNRPKPVPLMKLNLQSEWT